MVVKPRVVAVIPAAGAGVRMGSSDSKVFLELGGETLLRRTISTVLACSSIEKVGVVLREEDYSKAVQSLPDSTKVKLIKGGDTRQESVRRGFEGICDLIQNPLDNTYVLIHDAARCLVSLDLIQKTIEAAFRYQAVTTAVPSIDSLIRVSEEGGVQAYLPRKEIMLVQTPQVFRADLLKKAHATETKDASDDASLVEKYHPIKVIEGDRWNIKITYPEDLVVAKALVFSIQSQ